MSLLLQGTKQLLDLARSFNNLQAFVHVSSAYTNMNAKPGSLVEESIYRLSYGDQLVNDHELVQVGGVRGGGVCVGGWGEGGCLV